MGRRRDDEIESMFGGHSLEELEELGEGLISGRYKLNKDDEIENIPTKLNKRMKRAGFSTIPNVKWDDVGGLHSLRREFDRYIITRIKFPKIYKEFGVDLDIGILLYGPPGCGKSLIAKAVANEAGANFIHIKGPEIMSMFVGETESEVRRIFSRARTCSPCIIFFDEVDALATTRGAKDYTQRIMKQLMIELDGGEQRKGVYVIGATNKKVWEVDVCAEERGMILKALARKKPVDASVALMALGKDNRCNELSGADLSSLMNEAAVVAIADKQSSLHPTSKLPSTIKHHHFIRALQEISPSVSDKQIQHYQALSETFKAKY